MNRILTAAITCLVAMQAAAQSIPFDKAHFANNPVELKEAIASLEIGNSLYKHGADRYRDAIAPFEKAYALNPNNAQLNYRLGSAYLHSPSKEKAPALLQKAYELDKNIDPEIQYTLGRAYHLNMQWDKAMSAYKAHRKSISAKATPEQLADVTKKIKECENGMVLVKKPARVSIKNLGQTVNTSFSEYAPVITADESMLMFTGRRDNSTGGLKDKSLNDFFEDVYITSNNAGQWTASKNIGKPINTPDHDAVVALSPDGQRLIVYLEENSGDLFECKLAGDQWQKPVAFGSNINTDNHESSAAYAPDGRTLYFVSNKEEGTVGKHDIWKADLTNPKAAAVNLGGVINTPYNEEGIFVHPDGKTIYFSSEGHNSMGGLDIFKSVYENNRWSKPENLGYPINTPDDDVFFVMSANGKHGYYSSDQAGGMGNRDIYMITFLGPEKKAVFNSEDYLLASASNAFSDNIVLPKNESSESKLTLLKGIITDPKTGLPIETTIEIVDNKKKKVIATFNSNSTTGKYLVSLPSGVNYGITVKKDGYLFHSENFDIPATAAYAEVNKNMELKKPEVGVKVVLNNIFFDFNKAALRSESTYELDRMVSLMKEMPNLKIEISGHTDNVGAAQVNQTLSESRAKAVTTYLLSKGVNKSRISSIGYGFTQPVASNDTDEGRQQNRRTEFKIMGK